MEWGTIVLPYPIQAIMWLDYVEMMEGAPQPVSLTTEKKIQW